MLDIPYELAVILVIGIPLAGIWLYAKGQEKAEKDRRVRESGRGVGGAIHRGARQDPPPT